jgi:anti-anti-sigma regulatory factor
VIATEVDAAGEPVVVLSGEIDMTNASSLSAAVASITAAQPSRLTFELAGLRFIDSGKTVWFTLPSKAKAAA